LKREDKSVDDMHDRIDDIMIESSSVAAVENDDEYYLDQGQDPPRFFLYRQARAEKWQATGPHGMSDYDKTTTQDELDYRLKERLRVPPEKRYQREKEHYYFHDLYVDGGEECNPMRNGCTPNCRFHAEAGRIEDDEVIEEHNKLVEEHRQRNEIIEPPSEAELQRLAKIYHFK
jgi:hypothetical protein